MRAGLARGIVAVMVATGALVSTMLPAQATSISEFSTGITSPGAQITYGPDGNSWFTEPTGNKIGKITPAGVVTEYASGIAAAAGLGAITAGPDGNVWFTESGADKVGRITPAGVVTEFTTGITPGSSPEGIVAGPDGNLWFTEDKVGGLGADGIGRITPTGTVTIFTTGLTTGTAPTAMAAGADGNLWFTEQSGGRIGRVTTAGVINEFADGLSPLGLGAIATGQDGNLWVTESSAGEIARVTTAGVATQFSTGITPSSQPASITSGPDGSLWFTEASGDRVGQITPAGAVTEYAGLTPSGAPDGIAMGPDLNLWFTESGGSRIGRVYQPGMRGVDVSSFSLSVDWSQVAAAGYSFGYARYGDGTTLVDTTFSTNWTGMGDEGMSRGGYLTFEPDQSATTQATDLVNGYNSAAFTSEDLVPAFDVETLGTQSASAVVTDLTTAVDQVHASLGVWPAIFTNYSFWFTTLGNPTSFSANDPLWMPTYAARSPRVPASDWGGRGWSIWQYTGSGAVPGIGGAADIDLSSWAGLPLMAPATVPGPPTAVSATAGTAQATLSWTAPTNTGGSEITGYKVTPFIGATAQTTIPTDSNATGFTVNSLLSGTTYTFKVAAINSIGTGSASAASNAVTPSAASVPGPPTAAVATAGNARVSLTWTAPASDGGSAITSYRVTPFIGATAQTAIPTGTPGTSFTVSGLTNGTTYTFTIAATNVVGTGPPSTASNPATPSVPPPVGTAYVANPSSITEYALGVSGNVTPLGTISGSSTGLNAPSSIAVAHTGTLFVANAAGNSITEYAMGATGDVLPLRTISGAGTGLNMPDGLAVDAAGTLYVSNSATPSITEYATGATGNATPLRTISGASTGLNSPSGVVLDSAGTLDVANSIGNSITEYAAGSTGNAAPLRTISGASTGLNAPKGVALDSAGTLFVANPAGSSITEYSKGATGNTAAAQVISGSNTGLHSPSGVAIDSTGTLYVANQTSSSITEYSMGATGNSIPLRTITGSSTGLLFPTTVAVGYPERLGATQAPPSSPVPRSPAAQSAPSSPGPRDPANLAQAAPATATDAPSATTEGTKSLGAGVRTVWSADEWIRFIVAIFGL
ncbi:MAG TPA: GH25 family lysozyme [Candidatus Acidoferrum sp.]|jgi:virginiamycin B lyase|nr:GH25 family lysozyme [Candidatus Acidoferrum sp.]